MDSCELRVTAGGFLGGREALKVSGLAAGFASDVFLQYDELKVKARSVAGLMILGVVPGDSLTVRASGPDAAEAARAVAGMVAAGVSTGMASSGRSAASGAGRSNRGLPG
jgi:phosphotransferase system HPr (HPr) family protein